MDKISLYEQRIRKEYPELSIRSVEYNEVGQNNDVLIVNGELVFRFPKYEAGIREIAKEVQILSEVKKHVSLSIPVPVYQSFASAQVGHVFVGYRMIPGVPLWKPIYQSIVDAKSKRQLAARLGTFLRELHSVPIDERIGYTQPRQSGFSGWADMYERIRNKLFPYMNPESQRHVSNHFERFLGERSNERITPVLIHGDFGTSNIIFDPDKQTIAGIIDFGGSCLDDPAVDFAALLSSYGLSFVQTAGEAYPNFEAILPRIRFYAGTFALQEALFGLEHDDGEAFDNGIAGYR